MADFYSPSAWLLYANFVRGKDNSLFTPANMDVSFGFLSTAHTLDLANHITRSDAEAVGAVSNYIPGTATLAMANEGDDFVRFLVSTTNYVDIDTTGVTGAIRWLFCYETASERLIAILDIDESGSITIPPGDGFRTLIMTSSPIYRQIFHLCSEGGGEGGEF